MACDTPARHSPWLAATLLLITIAALPAVAARAEVKTREFRTFEIVKEVVLPGTPMDAWEALTGDISVWWDHKFSQNPASFRIEPFVGGRFIEEFRSPGDDRGAGVVHARVIYAVPGEKLVLDGPLGFVDYAVKMVHTFTFAANGDGTTTLRLRLGYVGEYQAGWSEALDSVWEHFLVARLKVYMEAGCTEAAPCTAFEE